MSDIGVGSNAGLWEVQKENQRFLLEEYMFWETSKYSVAAYRLRDSNGFINYGLFVKTILRQHFNIMK
jgi:hypothetical protein